MKISNLLVLGFFACSKANDDFFLNKNDTAYIEDPSYLIDDDFYLDDKYLNPIKINTNMLEDKKNENTNSSTYLRGPSK